MACLVPEMTGLLVDDHLKFLELLGSGSYGAVYKVLDLSLPEDDPKRLCAVKVMRKINRKLTELATIRHEIAYHSQVSDHPNIVTLRDAFDDSEHFYVILDLVNGGDLFDHICIDNRYYDNDNLLRNTFVQIIDAVKACHDKQIAHRDLKPENILASEDGSQIFLADFGLATDKRMVEPQGAGTPLYMAPECYNQMNTDKLYDARSADVWALGVILVNMIGNANPWERASVRDRDFIAYLNNPETLQDRIPMSNAAFKILRRIFSLNPLRRPTLHELRNIIMRIETFFEQPGQYDEYDDLVLCKFDDLSIDVPVIVPTAMPKYRGLDESSPRSSHSSSEDSEEVVTPPATDDPKAGPLDGVENVTWRKGSTAQMLINKYKLRNGLEDC